MRWLLHEGKVEGRQNDEHEEDEERGRIEESVNTRESDHSAENSGADPDGDFQGQADAALPTVALIVAAQHCVPCLDERTD